MSMVTEDAYWTGRRCRNTGVRVTALLEGDDPEPGAEG